MSERPARARAEELLLECIREIAVDGGGMSLVSTNGLRQPLYGSDDTAAVMERLQFTLGEGPCVEASVSGSPVLVADLDDPGSGAYARWPVFLDEATKAHIGAVFAFPVRVGAISLGAIDLYRMSPGPLDKEELSTTLTTVDAIAAALLDGERALHSGLDMDRLSSMEVHRAAGMVMAQMGTTIEEALVRLRATAYADGVPIEQLANDVIHGRRRFEEETE